MKLDGERDVVQTLLGSLCSLILAIVVIAYTNHKIDVWLNKMDIEIITAKQVGYFDEDYVFSFEQGLNFAIAFTAYDQETEDILDPSYGKLMFARYEWGERADTGELYSEISEIPSHTCTRQELGIDGGQGSFLPLAESQMRLVETYQKKMKCIEPAEMRINGDYNSAKASLINIRLVRCSESDGVECKPQEEITRFFRNKFLFLLFNERIFDSGKYLTDSIVPKSSIKWFQVNTQQQ